MLRNYLKITLRNLRQRPGYTFINVAGLAVGMTVCLLIGLYVDDELAFDRFHEDADRLMVVGVETGFWGRDQTTPYPLGAALAAELPEVEQAVRTSYPSASAVIREDTQLRNNRIVLLADPNFFATFSFPLVTGDPATVLSTPDAAVVTEATARIFFGDENPIGKTLHVQRFDSTYAVTVRGVARNAPEQSTIRFDVVVSLQILPEHMRREDGWGAYMYRTYARLNEGVTAEAFGAKMNAALGRHFGDEPPSLFAVPLPAYYLSDLNNAEGFKGQKRYIILFGSVALFVLLIAAINYVNLVTAQATRRAREVGVRKALGAGRFQLMRQFLSESVLLSVAALLAAIGLTELTLPAFNTLFDKALALDLQAHGATLAGLSAFVLAIGIAAGAYPAFVLSRFQPVRVLRGAGTSNTGGGHLLRKSLVVVQFAISVALIVSTIVVYRQLGYMQSKNLGFDGEQVVTVDLTDAAWQAREDLAAAARTHTGVQQATVSMGAPGSFGIRIRSEVADVSPQARTEVESITFAPAVVDYDFVETLGIRLIAGRDFDRDFPADETRAYLLNETAVAELGWTAEEAVGQSFRLRDDAVEGEVIGVVQDFHIASLRDEVEPVSLQLYEDDSWRSSGMLIARLAPEQIQPAMKHLEALVTRYAPDEPFEYAFLDDTFDAMYRTEQRLSQVFTSFAVLAVFVACLGLFGLASYTAEQRTKEIGIRKVLGATVSNIVGLLSRDFVLLVGIAFGIAAPVAYYGMNRWLEDFAYRIDISWGVFLVTGLTALGVALLTISYQAIRAALADPVKALRYE